AQREIAADRAYVAAIAGPGEGKRRRGVGKFHGTHAGERAGKRGVGRRGERHEGRRIGWADDDRATSGRAVGERAEGGIRAVADDQGRARVDGEIGEETGTGIDEIVQRERGAVSDRERVGLHRRGEVHRIDGGRVRDGDGGRRAVVDESRGAVRHLGRGAPV